MSGKINYPNEYNTFENKLITKISSNTKQINRIQNIQIKLWKYNQSVNPAIRHDIFHRMFGNINRQGVSRVLIFVRNAS